MSAEDTKDAIGAVSRLLQSKLAKELKIEVSVGRPDKHYDHYTAHINLFLYEIQFDSAQRNNQFDSNKVPPVWLAARYLLTAFDDKGESDSDAAHDMMGWAIRAIQNLQVIPLSNEGPALRDSPEPLRITRQDTPVGLLTELMSNESKYHFSISLQVRPIILVPTEERTRQNMMADRNNLQGGIVRTKLGNSPQ